MNVIKMDFIQYVKQSDGCEVGIGSWITYLCCGNLFQLGTVQHNAEVNSDLYSPSTINTRPVQILSSKQVAVSMYLLQSVFLHLSAVNYTPSINLLLSLAS